MIEKLERQLDYWRMQLANAPTLDLPTDRPRPAVQSLSTENRQFSLSLDLVNGLKALSQHEGVTLFITLVAAFQVLLHRYSGQDDIVIGTPTAKRSHSEAEGLLGSLFNTLLLRADLSGNPSFRELLAQVREVVLEAYANQDISFEKLVEALNPLRDRSRNPMFQVMFVLQNIPDNRALLNRLTPELLQLDTENAKCDLIIELTEIPNNLSGWVEYSTDLFEASTIDRLIGHFQTLLEGILAHPDARLSELPLLTEPERRQLLAAWNDTAAEFPRDKCIHELFEAQAAATPQAVAVVYEDSRLTYAELNVQSNQLAHHLRELGVKPDALVAICAERSLNMVIGLLAILKAGGAYVPLDPDYPSDRLAYMLDNCSPVALLTQSTLMNIRPNLSIPLIMLDTEASTGQQSECNLDPVALGLTSKHLAYVIYTSGSTGLPKGVMNQHDGVVNRLLWAQSEYRLGCDDRVLQKTPFSFDVSVWEFFLPLIVGSPLVMARPKGHQDPHYLADCIESANITTMHFVPSMLQVFLDQVGVGRCRSLRRVLCSGEALSYALQERFLTQWPGVELHNLYGPTEAAIDVTSWLCTPTLHAGIVPIGHPITNIQIYILDGWLQPVPLGVSGEIYIGGIGVARGYLNLPELTEERFIRDPFSPNTEARLYKTGDLGRWLQDGNVEYLGRNDFQVKIRGFRIELGEIEALLAKSPGVRDAVVIAREDKTGDKRLMAYLVLKDDFKPSISALRDFIKSKMPELMVPSVFVFLDALPLTPNGKVDRKALPEPDQNRQVSDVDFVAPRNSIEQQLTEIWSNALSINHIGIHDNFFALGGHSLLAVNAITEVNKLFNTDLPLGVMYQSPTIEELGIIISSGNWHPSRYSLVPIQTQGSRPPLFAIHTITLLDLPRNLGKDQPLYFIRYGMAAEVGNRSVRLPSLEELADHYIKEMQQVQPHGPYYLIGFSFGGLIAYEMAGQLLANGHQVNLVGLLDTYLKEEKRLQPLHRIIRNLFRQGPNRLLASIKSKITDLLTPNEYGQDFWPHIYTPAPDETCRSNYQPKSYKGRVTLFQGWEPESNYFSYILPEQAWKKLLGERLEVQRVPGTHFDICKEPHVKVLVAKLMVCMDETINDD